MKLEEGGEKGHAPEVCRGVGLGEGGGKNI